MLTALRMLWGRCTQALGITNENGGGPPAKAKSAIVVVEPVRALPEPARPNRAEPREARDPRRELERDCYVLAYNHARKSWELEPNEATLKALEAEGSSRAMALHRARSEAKEQRQTAKFQDLAAKEKRLLAARDRARAVAQARRQDLARLGPPRARPAIPPVLMHTATLALAISIAPTLHDLFVGFDPYVKWLVGGGCAWGVSVLIIQGILPAGAVQQDHKEQTRKKEENQS